MPPKAAPRLPAHSAFGFASPPVAAPPGLEITVGGHTTPLHLDARPTALAGGAKRRRHVGGSRHHVPSVRGGGLGPAGYAMASLCQADQARLHAPDRGELTPSLRAGSAGPDAQPAAKRKNAIMQQTIRSIMLLIYVEQGLHNPKPHQGIFYQEQGCIRENRAVSSRPH